MRQVIEAVKGMEVDDTDGIKVFETTAAGRRSSPTPTSRSFHLYAEGSSGRNPSVSSRSTG